MKHYYEVEITFRGKDYTDLQGFAVEKLWVVS